MHLSVQLPTQRRRPGGDRAAAKQGPVRGDHAVVLGASMSGLLSARVLADHFAQVTVVERDVLDGGAGARRGVPQGRHAHVLLPRGAKVLDELFPGILDELATAGVPLGESLAQFHMEVNGHRLFHDPDAPGVDRTDGALYEPSRPFLERHVLERVRRLGNVDVIDGHDVEDLLRGPDQTRVTGARVVPRSAGSPGRDLFADLTVCATGRSGRAQSWLTSMGYDAPVEEEVAVDLMYVSGHVRFPEGTVEGRRMVLIGALPERPTAIGAFAQEDGIWIVTLAGYAGHHPPTDRAAWLEFADRIVPPDFAAALHAAEPLDELRQHRFPANLRRRYDKLARFPERFLVTGDAVCSFNPVYGQGMTVAALEALAMADTLDHGWDHLAARFFKAAARPVGDAWRFAIGADLALPVSVVPGPRPLPVRAVNAYVDRFQAAAEGDPVMAWRFLDVTGFERPTTDLFSADSLRRVVADRRNHRDLALVPGF